MVSGELVLAETTKLVQALRGRGRQNFGVSFSVIGVTGGVSSLFLLGLVSVPLEDGMLYSSLTVHRSVVDPLS
jgi:hypothetical protein